MARKVSELIGEAQFILQDEEADRYPLSRLLEIFNRALKTLSSKRPDAFFDTYSDTTDDIVVPQFTTGDYSTSDFPIPDMFYTPLVHYVAGAAELIDDEFATDSRAGLLLQSFIAEIMSVA